MNVKSKIFVRYYYYHCLLLLLFGELVSSSELLTDIHNDEYPDFDRVKMQLRKRKLIEPLPINDGSLKSAGITNGNSSSNKHKKRIPNVLLVGAQKAGTSATWGFLASHNEDVCNPHPIPGISYTNKEAHFFDKDSLFYSGGLGYYQDIYEHCQDDKILLDGTPNYLSYPDRVKEIYDQAGTAEELKIIMILREPVSREISWYEHLRRDDIETTENHEEKHDWGLYKEDGSIRSFEDYTEDVILPNIENKLNYGLYAYWIEEWMQYFNREQILILSYHDFKVNSEQELKRIVEFIDLPNVQDYETKHLNSAHVEVEPIPCIEQETLADIYEEYNTELYDILDKYPGPPMEKRPFTKFQFHCKQ